MDEYNRIILEKYCWTHSSKKAKRLEKLVEASYDLGWTGTDDDAIFLEKCIEQEKNEERRAALEDLDEFLFRY